MLDALLTDRLKKSIDTSMGWLTSLALLAVAAVCVAAIISGGRPAEVIGDALGWAGIETPDWLVRASDWMQDPSHDNLFRVATVISAVLVSAGISDSGAFANGLNLVWAWYLLLVALEGLGRGEVLAWWIPAYLLIPALSLIGAVAQQLMGYDPREEGWFNKPVDVIVMSSLIPYGWFCDRSLSRSISSSRSFRIRTPTNNEEIVSSGGVSTRSSTPK